MLGAIDTLKIYERLKVAKLEDSAAKEIAEVLNDVIEKHFVTNTSLKETEERIKAGSNAALKETELKLMKEIKELDVKIGMLDVKIGMLDVKIGMIEGRLIRWSFVFWITQFAAILGIGFIILKAMNALEIF